MSARVAEKIRLPKGVLSWRSELAMGISRVTTDITWDILSVTWVIHRLSRLSEVIS